MPSLPGTCRGRCPWQWPRPGPASRATSLGFGLHSTIDGPGCAKNAGHPNSEPRFRRGSWPPRPGHVSNSTGPKEASGPPRPIHFVFPAELSAAHSQAATQLFTRAAAPLRTAARTGNHRHAALHRRSSPGCCSIVVCAAACSQVGPRWGASERVQGWRGAAAGAGRGGYWQGGTVPSPAGLPAGTHATQWPRCWFPPACLCSYRHLLPTLVPCSTRWTLPTQHLLSGKRC